MKVQQFFIAVAGLLAACASYSDDPPFAAHSQLYSREVSVATEEYRSGTITAEQLQARIRAASDALASADAATARQLAAKSPSAVTGPSVSPQPHDNGCLFISCSTDPPAVAGNTSPESSGDAKKSGKEDPKPAGQHENGCLLISCD